MCLGLARDLSRAGPKTSSLGTTTRDLGKIKSALGDPLLRRATGVLTAPRPSCAMRKYKKKVEVITPFLQDQIYIWSSVLSDTTTRIPVIIFQGPDLVAWFLY